MIKKLAYILVGLLVAFVLLATIGSVSAGPRANMKTKTPAPEVTLPPIVLPSPTLEPIFPTPTIQPGSTITAIPTVWNNDNPTKKSKKTPTATGVVFLVDSGNCPNDCMCLLVTQFVISNDLQRTAIANEARACVQP